MKTPSMNLFDYLYLSALILDIATVIAGWDYFVLDIHNQVHAAGGGPDVQVFYSSVAPWIVAATFIPGVLLWVFIALFRWSPVRYILAVFVGYEILSLIIGFPDLPFPVWILVLGCIATGLKIAATIMVFRSDAVAWLKREV